MPETKRINLRPKASDDPQAAYDRFWLDVTPKIFEWLRWAVILGAVTYVAKNSESLALRALVAICYIAMFSYFQAFFYQFEFYNFPWLKKRRWHRSASIILSGLLGYMTYLLISESINALVTAHP